MRGIDSLTLSYTFFKVDEDESEAEEGQEDLEGSKAVIVASS